MILYHGSPAIVSAPDVFHSRARVDFGKGFYTTPLREQAQNWCQRFMRNQQVIDECLRYVGSEQQ